MGDDGRNRSWLGSLQRILLMSALAGAYLLAGHFSTQVALDNGVVAPYYPAAGLALTALLLFGRRGLIVVIAGEILLQYTLRTEGLLIPLLAAGEALGALAAWEFLTRGGRLPYRLSRSADLGRLLSAALIYGSLAACAGLIGLSAAHGWNEDNGFLRWCIYALGDALGVISIVPLSFAWQRPSRSRSTPARLAEIFACASLTVLASLLTFLRTEGITSIRQPLAFPTFALQVWAALRFGLRGATLASLVLSVCALYGTAMGRGPFADFPGLEQAIVLQAYIFLHVVMGLMLAVLLYERERAEQELVRQREYLRQIVDICPDLIFVKDRQQRYVFVNQSMADLYGTTVKQMLGLTDHDLVSDPALAGFYIQVDREVLASGEERFIDEEPLLDHAGELHWVQVVKRPLLDEHGIPRQVLGVATDITQRRASQQELQEQRAYLRQIVDINPCLIFSKDRDGRFRLANQAVADMFGVSVEDLLGKTDADFNPNREEVEFFQQMDRDVLDSGEDMFIPEEQLTDSSGTAHWLQTIKRPIYDASGRAVEVLGVATDITSRKLGEQHRAQLEQRVREAQRLESLGILAGGVAHDFNNLLAAILGNADLALLDLAAEAPAAASVRRIRTTAQRASELAEQMLAYSGRGSIVRSPLDLNSLLREVVHLTVPGLAEEVAIELQLGAGLPLIAADGGQMRQLVLNLLSNAADALPASGGTITVATYNAMLETGSAVLLEVCDDGSGMDESTRLRVFDPFFSTKFTGRGLGMAAVLGIVRGHEGAVEIESAPGAGCTVRVTLPVQAAATAIAAGGPAPSRGQGSGGAVLVVDDDPAVCSVARRALSRAGYRVVEARDGDAALAAYASGEGQIAAVLLDLTMPGKSGGEVLAELLALDPGARVVISSGYSGSDVMDQVGSLRVSGFLQKPYEISELIGMFDELLRPPPS